MIDVRAWDNSGNAMIATISIMVDTVAPAVHIVIPSDLAFVNASEMVWNGTDLTSGIAGYRYRMDGGIWSPLAITTRNIFAGLADGEHVFEVKAFDRANNSATASVRFTLDTVRPIAAILAPVSGERLNQSIVEIGWDINGTGSPVKQIWTSLDGGAWIESEVSTTNLTITLADGTHVVGLRVVDEAGNTEITSLEFLVDTVAPTVITSPTGTNVPVNALISVLFSEEMNESSVTVDTPGIFATMSWDGPNLTLTPSRPLAHSHTYTVSVRGNDLAGNPVSAQWTFTVIANGTVYGKILDANGKPIANATISAGGKNVTSDAEGNFVINLNDGDYNLTITKEGKLLANVNATAIAGEEMDLGAIEIAGSGQSSWAIWGWILGAVAASLLVMLLAIARRRMFYVVVKGTMTGQVLDPDDHPIKEVTVTLADGMSTVSDAEGNFEFLVSEDVHQMTVEKKGRKSRSFPVTAAKDQAFKTEVDRMRRK